MIIERIIGKRRVKARFIFDEPIEDTRALLAKKLDTITTVKKVSVDKYIIESEFQDQNGDLYYVSHNLFISENNGKTILDFEGNATFMTFFILILSGIAHVAICLVNFEDAIYQIPLVQLATIIALRIAHHLWIVKGELGVQYGLRSIYKRNKFNMQRDGEIESTAEKDRRRSRMNRSRKRKR